MSTERKSEGAFNAATVLVRAFANAGAILLVILILLFGLAIGTQFGITQVLYQLVVGFWFFLKENLSQVVSNAATWVPGLVAFFGAIVVMHFLLREWAGKTGRQWRWGTSVALASVVPVLFVIAFLVPGVFLQVRELSDVRWFHREAGKGGSTAQSIVSDYRMALFEYSETHEGRFPASIAEVEQERIRGPWGGKRHPWNRDLPPEEPIYLGPGLTDQSDPSLALVITPAFQEKKGPCRYLLTIGGEKKKIPTEDLDAWIERSLDARRAESP
ncbi:hypothetical protein [Luteolibacter sp. Populi]|uniref:hypothetical protein n=1 Tax=Luteolibacter sp. Populi TaxID=3230487 RepID=UPI00346673EC